MKIVNKNLGTLERQANVDALINRLVNSKKEMLDEMKSDFQKPAFQAALQKLRKMNELQLTSV